MTLRLSLIPLSFATLAFAAVVHTVATDEGTDALRLEPLPVAERAIESARHPARRDSSIPGWVGDEDGARATEAAAPPPKPARNTRPVYGFEWGNGLELWLRVDGYGASCSGAFAGPSERKWTGATCHGKREGPWEARDTEGQLRELRHYRAGVLHGPARDWFGNGALETEWAMRNGRYHGRLRGYDRDGRLRKEGDYLDGERDGAWVFIASEGSRDITHYRRGKRHGAERHLDASGNLVLEARWAEGRPAGTFRRYGAGGQLLEIAEYREGGLDGWWRRWHPDGRLAAEGFAIENRPVGHWRSWHADGTPCARRFFREGLREGVYEIRGENGVLTRREHFRDGRSQGRLEEWDEYGRILLREHYVAGARDGRHQSWKVDTLWDEESDEEIGERHRLDYQAHYRAGELHGTELSWNAEAVLIEETEYRDGDRHGQNRVYDDAGTLREERFFAADEAVGQERTWHENGRLATEVRGLGDDDFSSHREWDATGQLRSVSIERGDDSSSVTLDPRGVIVESERYREGVPVGEHIGGDTDVHGRVVVSWRSTFRDDGELVIDSEPVIPRPYENTRPVPGAPPGVYRCGRTAH